ncbi:hypothetical protein AB0F18_10370 [Streptomyces sp. NPDC029216]|uniref:hypothetical protein n=1 Tax=Streptomyces sp. NPDC029216 TaxID=3154701 RepID=UPI0033E0766F
MSDRRGAVRLADGVHAVRRLAPVARDEFRALDEAGEYGQAGLPADEDVLALGDMAGRPEQLAMVVRFPRSAWRSMVRGSIGDLSGMVSTTIQSLISSTWIRL